MKAVISGQLGVLSAPSVLRSMVCILTTKFRKILSVSRITFSSVSGCSSPSALGLMTTEGVFGGSNRSPPLFGVLVAMLNSIGAYNFRCSLYQNHGFVFNIQKRLFHAPSEKSEKVKYIEEIFLKSIYI